MVSLSLSKQQQQQLFVACFPTKVVVALFSKACVMNIDRVLFYDDVFRVSKVLSLSRTTTNTTTTTKKKKKKKNGR